MAKINVRFFQVKCGDAISIDFKIKDRQYNILVDSGYINTYKDVLKNHLRIANKNGGVALWLLTHLDADHINGAVSFLRDKHKDVKYAVEKIIFNCFKRFTLPEGSDKKAVKHGIEIRDVLKSHHTKLEVDVIEGHRYTFGDVNIKIIGPSKDRLDNLKPLWKKKEAEYWAKKTQTKKGATDSERDYNKTIIELVKNKLIAEKKSDVVNASSIAFILERNKKRFLFLGDSYPKDIIAHLKKEKGAGKRLKFDYVKLSHHGSKVNFDPKLLDQIDCKNFIISSDAVNKHKLPNKETLARILTHPGRKANETINFIFNYDHKRFRQMFDVDKNAYSKYNFICTFPSAGNKFIEVGL